MKTKPPRNGNWPEEQIINHVRLPLNSQPLITQNIFLKETHIPIQIKDVSTSAALLMWITISYCKKHYSHPQFIITTEAPHSSKGSCF